MNMQNNTARIAVIANAVRKVQHDATREETQQLECYAMEEVSDLVCVAHGNEEE